MPAKKKEPTNESVVTKKRASKATKPEEREIVEVAEHEVIEAPKKRSTRRKQVSEVVEREYVEREVVDREFVEPREYVDRDDVYEIHEPREVVEREIVEREEIVVETPKKRSRSKKADIAEKPADAEPVAPSRRRKLAVAEATVEPAAVEAAPAEPAVAEQPVEAAPAEPAVAEQPVEAAPAEPAVAEQPVEAAPAEPAVAEQPVEAVPAEPAVAEQPVEAVVNKNGVVVVDGKIDFMSVFGFQTNSVDVSNRPKSRPIPPRAKRRIDHDETDEPVKTPFVAKKLRNLYAHIAWPSTETHMPIGYFPKYDGDIADIEPVKFEIDAVYDAGYARSIQKHMRRISHIPPCDKDCAPIVLATYQNMNPFFVRRDRLSKEPEITTAKLRALVAMMIETMPPLHFGANLTTDPAYALEVSDEPAPLGEVTLVFPEENAPAADDPVAFLEYFEKPLEPFSYDELEDKSLASILYNHTVNHCTRILDLIKTWSSKLPLIDQGFVRPSDNQPIARLFYRRFVECLNADFTTAEALNINLPDQRIMKKYALDEIDLFILWLVASLQIDPDVREYLIPVWTLGNVVVMSAAIVMRFVATNQLERSEIMYRMSPSSPLQMNDLIRVSLTRGPTMPLYFECMVPEQLSLQFAGTTSLSTTSASYATLQYPTLDENTFIAPDHARLLDLVRNFITRPILNANPQLRRENLNFVPSLPFLIEGLAGSGRTTLMKLVASRLDVPIIIVDCSALALLAPDDFNNYFQDLFQDAELLNALVCLQNASAMLTEARYTPILTRQLSNHAIVVAFCVDLAQTVSADLEPFVTFKLKMTANLKENAVSYWKPHLSLPFVDNSNVDVLELSHKLALQPFQIQKAARLAYYATPDVKQTDHPEIRDVVLNNSIIQKSASEQVSKNIGNLAFVSDPEVSLDDVIVSDEIMTKIKQIIGSAQNRRRVLYEWGLCKRIKRGTGVICLFDGEPGTGKTHSAEAIARCLGLSLMRVNIASMVDKYIGETEKNLTKIFEQARPDMSLLLFDEADSLFTKRTSNVSKSNDRYSNMSVNVLLQLVERYEGVSILTTNLKKSIDPAFERRITYKIYFAMPKKEERKRLWQYMCPPDVLTGEPLDYDWLSELEMSGGEIKNAVLAGAFRAATLGKLLDTEILYDAGVSEAAAAGRVMRHYDDNFDGFE